MQIKLENGLFFLKDKQYLSSPVELEEKRLIKEAKSKSLFLSKSGLNFFVKKEKFIEGYVEQGIRDYEENIIKKFDQQKIQDDKTIFKMEL